MKLPLNLTMCPRQAAFGFHYKAENRLNVMRRREFLQLSAPAGASTLSVFLLISRRVKIKCILNAIIANAIMIPGTFFSTRG